MKKINLFIFLTIAVNAFSQNDSFDLITYSPPKGWKKEVTENITSYTIVNKANKTWCQIGIVKSTISKGTIEQDFESEWQELVVKNYQTKEAPQLNDGQEADGWKVRAGGAKFIFNKANAIALLTTMSGFNRCVSIVATTNSQRYLKDIETLVSSIDLKKPEVVSQQTTGNIEVKDSTISVKPLAVANSNVFTFTTTNFDDGWVATEQADWVQVVKGTTRVLIHYPNKKADEYNSSVLEGLKNAWNVLVAPKYSTASNFEFKPISSWQTIEFAEADVVETATGKSVHVVLFKMNYSSGNGRYLEFITPDKSSFEQEFGAYHASTVGWEKMEKMANYNRFAIAAADLLGKWTSDFSGAIQYVNAYTGFDAGMNTHASNENFQFGPGNTYQWDLGVASGMVGNIKFQSVKSSGAFSMAGNWNVKFSDIERKPRTYDAYFSCIKGFRVLWLDNKPFAKAE